MSEEQSSAAIPRRKQVKGVQEKGKQLQAFYCLDGVFAP
jgi:hypothetical protein